MRDGGCIVLANVTRVVRSRKFDVVFPLGMLYLAGSLRRAGFEVRTFNIATEEIPGLVERLRGERILFFGVCSILTGPKIEAALELSEAVAAGLGAPVVWGGIFPSAEPAMCLEAACVDLVGVGEGEELIVDIARIYRGELRRADVPGVAFRGQDGQMAATERRPPLEDLDRFTADFTGEDPARYIYDFDRETKVFPYPVMASRGCPFNCSFCYNSAFNRRRWRKHSVDYVVEHLRRLKALADFDYVILADDNAFVDKARFFELAERLLAEGIRISHFGLKLTRLEDEDLDRFVRLQIKSIYFGIESFQARPLELCKKEHTPEQVRRAIALIKRHPDLKVVAGIVGGMPGETFEEMRLDLRELLDHISFEGRLEIYFALFFPMPQTDFARELERTGAFVVRDLAGWARTNPYESERLLREIRRDASPRDLRMAILGKRYTEKILNTARRLRPDPSKPRPFLLLYAAANAVRRGFFNLARWRVRTESWFLGELDFKAWAAFLRLEERLKPAAFLLFGRTRRRRG